jgi:nicotinate-nucleotide adenylyltransferase
VKKIGILGGTFDPVHTGHLIVAQDVLSALSLDRVMLIPASTPPHKSERELTPPEHRMRMVDLALHGNQDLVSSDIEIARKGVSYTVDTLRELRGNGPADHEYYFVVGSDNLAELGTWKEPEELARRCTLVVIPRPGFADVRPPKGLAVNVVNVKVTAVDISSKDIRERVRTGKPIRYLVPETVEEYIRKEKLYHGAALP